MNADKLTPDALQALMRHKNYQTTQVYINITRQMDAAVASLHVPEVCGTRRRSTVKSWTCWAGAGTGVLLSSGFAVNSYHSRASCRTRTYNPLIKSLARGLSRAMSHYATSFETKRIQDLTDAPGSII